MNRDNITSRIQGAIDVLESHFGRVNYLTICAHPDHEYTVTIQGPEAGAVLRELGGTDGAWHDSQPTGCDCGPSQWRVVTLIDADNYTRIEAVERREVTG